MNECEPQNFVFKTNPKLTNFMAINVSLCHGFDRQKNTFSGG